MVAVKEEDSVLPVLKKYYGDLVKHETVGVCSMHRELNCWYELGQTSMLGLSDSGSECSSCHLAVYVAKLVSRPKILFLITANVHFTNLQSLCYNILIMLLSS